MKRNPMTISMMAACLALGGTLGVATFTPVSASASAIQGRRPPHKLAVPANWITMVDKVKGYEFQVPDGTTHHSDTVDGVDVYFAQTPRPSDIGVIVVAFKDKTLTREDLLAIARKTLENLGETSVRCGGAVELSPDYALAEGAAIDKDRKKSRFKVLVATDKTDNYIMIVGADADKFEANEEIIDEIWGSFSMYSGGASGES